MSQIASFSQPLGGITQLNERARAVFRAIVEAYLETGEAVGSRTLSRTLGLGLSPATIRNVMQDLEEAGLLFAPHTSAGRLPTDIGLRLFVDGLLEHGNVTREEQAAIDAQCLASGKSVPEILEEASSALSGLSHCAGLVVAPKLEEPLKHIEFVNLGPGRALVVLVTTSGVVENRIIDVPVGLPAASLVEASNYLAARLVGRSLREAGETVKNELESARAELDQRTQALVQQGLAIWAGGRGREGALILKGQAQLLQDISALGEIERVRQLFSALETKESLLKLLSLTETADGVRIFIGRENELFGLAGCSLVIAPYANSAKQIVGAIGVIGPTRLNYARVIPMVDYTAKVVGRLIG